VGSVAEARARLRQTLREFAAGAKTLPRLLHAGRRQAAFNGVCAPGEYRPMDKVNVGDTAPDFSAATDAGSTVKLSDYRGRRVVLYFYPKDDTPGCTTQACGFRDNYLAIEEKNAIVLGVSPDGAQSHQKFKTKFNLPFTLIADEDHSIAEAYGVWGEKSMYGKKYMGIERSHFVIDEHGVVVDAQVKVKPEDSVEKALAMLG
jgi:peroxiredoxin Q/BCP